jgi:hypothetical protein
MAEYPDQFVGYLWIKNARSFATHLIYFHTISDRPGTKHRMMWQPKVPEQKLSLQVARELWIAFVCGIIANSGKNWVIVSNIHGTFRVMLENVFKRAAAKVSGCSNWSKIGDLSFRDLEKASADLRKQFFD